MAKKNKLFTDLTGFNSNSNIIYAFTKAHITVIIITRTTIHIAYNFSSLNLKAPQHTEEPTTLKYIEAAHCLKSSHCFQFLYETKYFCLRLDWYIPCNFSDVDDPL